ncbi:hypothetical protein EVAR_58808_1 [Eumeta japonica]|uniref:Reverse transcriptase domain-containing protein n=1 Tax=Eumeta variegata TaxID=151549 RepID=A0A4C1YMZ1_EUMVA|nr:hypothetical protein EVAR_58808_1 [Eumeta japonica]
MDELSVKFFLYADDQVMLARLACRLQEMVTNKNDAVKKRCMKKNESGVNAEEMQSLRRMCGVSRKDRCRNSDVRERCCLKEGVVTRVKRVILGWFGHLERMNQS